MKSDEFGGLTREHSTPQVIMLNMFTAANCDALHKAIVHHCRPPYLVDQPVRPIAVLKEESVHGIGD